MGLFGNKKEGGILNVIRCDEKDFIIWKWSPDGIPSRRENAIRYGSSLRVKDSEVAVFVYKQKDGTMQDFIEGPLDKTIETANFPVLSGIVGSAFGGESPFQAEIYFINLSGNIQIPFYIEEFDVADPRFFDYAAPVSVKGAIMFNITDYRSFIKLNRMIDFSLEEFEGQIKRAVIRYTKSVITNIPAPANIPVLQIEKHIDQISMLVEEKLRTALAADFGVNVKRTDISDITINKETKTYRDLYEVTTAQQTELTKAQTKDTVERLRMGREVAFKAANLQTESTYLDTHKVNIQGEVALTAAESLGELGGGSIGGGGGDSGINPAGMMAGMMLGGAVGSNMANMMNGMMQNVSQPTPPPPPAYPSFHVYSNGAQTGPFPLPVVHQMIATGQITRDTLLWKPGMAGWQAAQSLPELVNNFGAIPPPPPPVL